MNYSIYLDVLLKAKGDLKDVYNYANQVNKELEKLNPKIRLDYDVKQNANSFTSLYQTLKDLQKEQENALKKLALNSQAGTVEYAKLEQQLISTYSKLKEFKDLNVGINVDIDEIKNLENYLNTLKLEIDTNDLIKGIDQSLSGLNQLKEIEFTNLKQLQSLMPEDDFNNLIKDLDKIINVLGDLKAGEEAEKIAKEYDISLKTLNNLIDAQKKSATLMKATGKEGSDAYKKMASSINETEKEINDLQKSVSKMDLNTKFSNLTSAFSNIGFVTQGIQSLTTSLKAMTEPFIGLDTATAKIKTLGGEAKNNAEAFRDLSLAMSKKIPITAEALQVATYEALSAGIKATQKDIEAFIDSSAKLAIGGGEDVLNTVNILSSLVNAYGVEASKSKEFSDILFQTVNFGKTSIAELSSSLSYVVPTAASFGVNLENIGAALALMTANGIPTTQATTKLNQLFVEMQKPSAEIANALNGIGITVEDLGAKVRGGNLIGALADMKRAFETAGLSATQAFGSIQASAAFNTLTKDISNLEEMLDGVSDSSGATEDAFETMSGTIEKRAELLKSKIDTLFVNLVDITGPLGEAGMAGVKILESLTPTITGISGAVSIFQSLTDKDKGLGSFTSNIKDKTLPGLSKLRTSIMETTAAQKIMNIVMKASKGPIGWIALGITAAVTASVILYKTLYKTAAEQKKINMENLKANKEMQKNNQEKQKQIENTQNLIKKYENLGNVAVRTADQEREFAKAQKELNKQFPDARLGANSFAVGLKNLKTAAQSSAVELARLKSQGNILTSEAIKLEIEIETNKFDEAEEKMKEMLKPGFWETAGNIALSTNLFTMGAGIYAAYKEFTQQQVIKSNVEALEGAKNSASVAKAKEDLIKEVMSSEKWQKMSAQEKNEFLKNVDTMANSKIAEIKKLEEQKQLLLQTKLKDVYSKQTEKDSGVLSDEEVAKIANETEMTVEAVRSMYAEIRNEATKNKVGDLIQESLVSKSNVDTFGKVGELVDDFKNAGTAIEKAKIAERIAKIAPEAVKVVDVVKDENGNLITSYELLEDKIDKAADKQYKLSSEELRKNQLEMQKVLAKEGEIYLNNTNNLKQLQKQIAQRKMKGLDTTELEETYYKTHQIIKNQEETFINSLAHMEKEGMATDDMYNEIAKTLSKSPEEIKKIVKQQKTVNYETQKELDMRQEITKEFMAQSDKEKKRQAEIKSELTAAVAKMRQIAKMYEFRPDDFIKKETEIITKLEKAKGIEQQKNLELYKSSINTYKKLVPELQAVTEQIGFRGEAEQFVNDLIKDQSEELDKHNRKTDQATQKAKTKYELIKDELNLMKESHEIQLNLYHIANNRSIISEKRKATDYDALQMSLKELEFFNKELAKAKELYQIKNDLENLKESEVFEFGITFNKDEGEKAKNEATKYITDLIKNINEKQIEIIDLEEQLNITKFEELLSKLDLEEQRINFVLEADPETLNQSKNNIKSILQTIMDTLQDDIKEINKSLAKPGLNEFTIIEYKNQLREKEKEYMNYTQKIMNIDKEIYEKQKQYYENQNKQINDDLNKILEKQQEVLRSYADAINRNLQDNIKISLEFDIADIDTALQNELDKLDEQYNKKEKLTAREKQYQEKKQEIEAEYQRKKEKRQEEARLKEQALERMHQNQLKNIETQANKERAAKEKEFLQNQIKEYQKYIAELQEKRKDEANSELLNFSIESQIKQIDKDIKLLDAKLGEVNEVLSLNNDILAFTSDSLISNFANIFQSMIVNEDSITSLKDGLKLILKTLAEFLSQLATAAVNAFVFSQANITKIASLSGGNPAVAAALIGASKLAMEAIIKTILSSVTSKLLSFSTGGRIDNATLAVVGDASKLGGSNKEWIFRDDQLRMLVNDITTLQNEKLNNSFIALQKTISNLNLTTTIKGQDLLLTMKRTQLSNNTRNY